MPAHKAVVYHLPLKHPLTTFDQGVVLAQANFTVTERDMVSMLRRACLHRLKLRVMAYAVIFLIIMKWGGTYTNWLLIGSALMLFTPSLGLLLLVPKMVRQSYIEDPALAEEREMNFGIDGVTYQTGSAAPVTKKWSSVKRWHENGRYISLALKNGDEFVVPVDQVSTSFVNGLKERLRSSGLPKPRRARVLASA